MEANMHSVKYERVITVPEEPHTRKGRQPAGISDRGGVHHNHSRDSQLSEEIQKMGETGFNHIKFTNINETEKDLDEEDIGFQGLGLRKYLEK